MCLYLHRKRICAYKRAAPNKEQRLNSSTCDVHAYSTRPMQTTPYIITIIIEDDQTKDRLDEVLDPSLEVEDLTCSQPKLKSRWSCCMVMGSVYSLLIQLSCTQHACLSARAMMMGRAKDLCAYKRYALNNEC